MSISRAAFQALAQAIRQDNPELSFQIFEIGARNKGAPEVFHELLDLFPQSAIYAFEADAEVCEEMNGSAKPGLTYYPYVLGANNSEVEFYETVNPMCSSLYKPREQYFSLFNALDVARLKKTHQVTTQTLNSFLVEQEIEDADFVKIDIQGAEVDVFNGGENALDHCSFVVTEVEFVQLYENQPLFGDVCQKLGEFDLSFHKFLSLEGRALRPIALEKPSQHMWSDAVFVHDLAQLHELATDKLMKTALLACLYESPDLAHFCMSILDARSGTEYANVVSHSLK